VIFFQGSKKPASRFSRYVSARSSIIPQNKKAETPILGILGLLASTCWPLAGLPFQLLIQKIPAVPGLNDPIFPPFPGFEDDDLFGELSFPVQNDRIIFNPIDLGFYDYFFSIRFQFKPPTLLASINAFIRRQRKRIARSIFFRTLIVLPL
jgi:hypothetical protein